MSDDEFKAMLPTLAESALDDQCTGANPRFPLTTDLQRILLEAYEAPIQPVKNLEFFSKVN